MMFTRIRSIRASLIRSDPAPQPAAYRTLRWQVVVDPDPDNPFLGRLFTWEQITRGGFDPGTVVEHIQTGERFMWNGAGMVKVE